jgi:excisionase family DNA binding protein
MERLLTLREVAEILRASPTTLRIWASKRKIPVIKVGRMVRVSPKELESWLRNHTCYKTSSHASEISQSRRTDSNFDEFIRGLKREE